MRILSVTAQKPNSTGSGVYLTELVRAFDSMGHAQAVVAGVYPEDVVAFPAHVSFYPVCFLSKRLPFPMPGMSDEMPYRSTVYNQMTPDMTEAFRRAFLQTIQTAVEAFRPDMILCHHLYLLTALVREAFPAQRVIAVCHGTGLRQLQKNPLWQPYIQEQLRKLDLILCLQRVQKDAIAKRFGVEEARIRIIGSGYNSEVFRPMAGMRRHKGYRIAYAGKLSEKKGVYSLLRAISQLPIPADMLRVTLAGGYDNADWPTVQALLQSCPFPVETPGRIPQEQLAPLLNGCDLFVLPSFYEGLPLVLAEALACGARVICTDIPGVRNWMDEHVPDHGIRFLPLPPMQDADTPVPASLPAFEQSLRDAIMQALDATKPHAPQLHGVSWEGVAEKILAAVSDSVRSDAGCFPPPLSNGL